MENLRSIVRVTQEITKTENNGLTNNKWKLNEAVFIHRCLKIVSEKSI